MRLIDAEALDGKLLADGLLCAYAGMKKSRYKIGEIRGMLQNKELAPTVDAVKVVHGKWEYKEDKICYWKECSVCHSKPGRTEYGSIDESPYCPNCGAKMDGRDKP